MASIRLGSYPPGYLAALDAWSRYLGGQGPLEVELNLLPLGPGVLAQGGPMTLVSIDALAHGIGGL